MGAALPSAATLLAAWEAASGRAPGARALALLEAAGQDAAHLPAGAREAALLRLRAALFGPELPALADCPACGTAVEFACTAEALCAVDLPEGNKPFEVSAGPHRVTLRLPDAVDLASAGEAGDVEEAAALLLARCVLSAECDSAALPPDALPDAVRAAIAAALAARDPLADARLALRCPDCGCGWDAAFDAGDFLWTEVDAWARRVLDDVHVLASAYGWTEAEVLRLPPRRRMAYRERIAACVTP